MSQVPIFFAESNFHAGRVTSEAKAGLIRAMLYAPLKRCSTLSSVVFVRMTVRR